MSVAWADEEIAVFDEHVPLTNEAAVLTADWPAWRWTVLAGDDALISGFPVLAEALYRRVLAVQIPEDAENAVYLKLVSSLIAQGRFKEARQYLELLKALNGRSDYHLRAAIIAYEFDEFHSFSRQLKRVHVEQLSRADKPWYYLLRGLQQRELGDLEASTKAIQAAISYSMTPSQAAQFEAILILNRIEDEPVSEALVELLQAKVEENQGTLAGIEFARELAVVLERLGRVDEALESLEAQLQLVTQEEWANRERLLLLLGLIAGKETPRGQLAFREMLEQQGSPQNQRVALYSLLAASTTEQQQAEFADLVKDIISDEQHSIRDEALLLQARLAMNSSDYELAGKSVGQLIEEYPGSYLQADALWLRALLAWQAGHYRTAANYLEQLRESKSLFLLDYPLNQLVGDAYFKNADYALAARVYADELKQVQDPKERQEIAYRLILSEIEAGDYEKAASHIDQMGFFTWLDAEHIWRAEYNLISAMRAKLSFEEAFARLNYRIYNIKNSQLPEALKARIYWLAVSLAYELAMYDVAVDYADYATDLLAAAPASGVDSAEQSFLLGALMLQKGRAQLANSELDAGVATLKDLRVQFPVSDAAIASYLTEARYLANQHRIVDAQRLLRELAENYPDSQQSPYALFEAAILAEKLGQQRHLEEARNSLQTLIEGYPEHPLVFQAKLSMGDIARQLNRFGAAQLVYENILQEYGEQEQEHPIYLAELYRADAIAAQSGLQPYQLDGAEDSFERLLDQRDVPIDVRVGGGV